MINELSFKDLKVWQKSIDFVNKVIEATEHLEITQNHKLSEQVVSAAAAISSNIAEGNARLSKPEFCQFLYIARGSLNETISLLNIFYKRKWITESKLQELEADGIEISRMIKGLINSLSSL